MKNTAGNQQINSPEAENLTAGDAEPVRQRLYDYWRSLGIQEEALLETLVGESLQRSRHKLARTSDPTDWLREALEETQRRFDHALARALHLAPAKDNQALLAARAALLLNRGCFSAEALFQAPEAATELAAELRRVLPQPTPPEAHLHMAEQPLSFWLFRSTSHHRG